MVLPTRYRMLEQLLMRCTDLPEVMLHLVRSIRYHLLHFIQIIPQATEIYPVRYTNYVMLASVPYVPQNT